MTFRLMTAVLICAGFTGCQSVDIEPVEFQRAQERTETETVFAKTALNKLQAKSISKNREYCGYIGLDVAGNFIATKPRKGRKSSCLAYSVSDDFRILASYHTHGAYSENYESELPSSDDLIADIDEGLDGYVATPGGRVWFNDARSETTALLCSAACVAADPNFDADDIPDIKRSYTLDELLALEE